MRDAPEQRDEIIRSLIVENKRLRDGITTVANDLAAKYEAARTDTSLPIGSGRLVGMVGDAAHALRTLHPGLNPIEPTPVECCASGRCEVCTPGYDWGRDG